MMTAMLLIVPLLAAVAIVFARTENAKWIALGGSLVTFLISVVLAFDFGQWRTADFGIAASVEWLPKFGIAINLGADSVAMMLVLLTTMLMPLCVWGSFTAITERIKEYYGWMMVLLAAMIGVFLARDLIFFYICFEFTLVPMFFLIAIWGGEQRTYAAVKFFIFTFTGSLIALAGLLYITARHAMHAEAWSFDIAALTEFAAANLTSTEQAWLLLALMIGFAVKVPLFPVHTWLPLAHTEAPTAGSVILAAVLLKLGTYAMYRFILPMLPEAVVEYTPFIAVLAIIGVLYAALICWVQTDVKKLIAYSSVSHLGFCVLGLLALNPLGLQGSVLYMLNHGLSTGALFFLVGMIYERYHTRDMNRMGGLSKVMPVWAFFMVFFVLASVGLPGLNGFVSEFLCLIAAFIATADNAQYPGVLGPWYAAIAGIGMIFAAMYLLIMVGKVVFGPLKEPKVDGHHHGPKLPADLTPREIGVLTPLAILCVVLGLYPKIATDAMEGSIEATLAAYPALVKQHHLAPALAGVDDGSPPTLDERESRSSGDGEIRAARNFREITPAKAGAMWAAVIDEHARKEKPAP
jgi:NADH-quinone oxidoreductase subunit M